MGCRMFEKMGGILINPLARDKLVRMVQFGAFWGVFSHNYYLNIFRNTTYFFHIKDNEYQSIGLIICLFWRIVYVLEHLWHNFGHKDF